MSALTALARRRPEFEACGSLAPKAEWSELNVEDLALAWLAVKGEAAAVAELERRLQRIARARSRGDDDFLEEVLQRTRQRLLVGELEKAQEALLAETRRRLGVHLKLRSREVGSLVRAMRPSLAENLSRRLPRAGGGASR